MNGEHTAILYTNSPKATRKLVQAVHSESSEVVSYKTTYSMSRAAASTGEVTASRLSWKISSSADAIEGDDGASIRDMEESKEPSSERGLDGTVVDAVADG